MKEPLKDGMDIVNKAMSGDAEAQLTIAKWYFEGLYFKKSLEQSKYWAFKPLSNGNESSKELYNAIIHEYNKVKLCDKIEKIPILEMLILGVPWLIMGIFHPYDNWYYDICLCISFMGFISFVCSLLFGSIGKLIGNFKGKLVGRIVGLVIVHILTLCLIFIHKF